MSTTRKLLSTSVCHRKTLVGALFVCAVTIPTLWRFRGVGDFKSASEPSAKEEIEEISPHCAAIRANVTADFRFDSPTDFRLLQLKDEMTIVTAYFNIGSFPKGSANAKRFTKYLYRQWMASFALINNPLIGFFDEEGNLDYFRSIRNRLPANRTCLVLVERWRLRSFSPETHSKISAIYGQPNNTKHYPNTVVPLYSMSMNAKYEVVQIAATMNPFSTRYVAWLDIGLFRDFTVASWRPSALPLDSLRHPADPPFSLYMPPGFNNDPSVENSSVAVCEIYARDENLTPVEIVRGNHVWIGGGFFAGRVDVMHSWTVEFLAGVKWLLERHISSTDQQVIYSIFNAASMNLIPPIRTRLQRYISDGRYNEWFHLAYVAREEGIKRMNLTTT